jgi:hypothetical protein
MKRSQPEPALVLEQFARATREVSEAVDAGDWSRALEALQMREGMLPALEKALEVVSSPAPVVSRLSEVLRGDAQCLERLLGEKARLMSELHQMGRMALWVRANQGLVAGPAQAFTDLEG